jgi:hypothetical protein
MHAVFVERCEGSVLVVVRLERGLGPVAALVHAPVPDLVQLPLLHVGRHVLPLGAQRVPLGNAHACEVSIHDMPSAWERRRAELTNRKATLAKAQSYTQDIVLVLDIGLQPPFDLDKKNPHGGIWSLEYA